MPFMMSSEPRTPAVDAMSETSLEETVGRNYFWLDCDARGPPSFGKNRADVSPVASHTCSEVVAITVLQRWQEQKKEEEEFWGRSLKSIIN